MWTDKSSVVLKSDYITLFRQSEELENRFSTEREARVRAKNELEGIEARFAELVLEKESVKRLKVENEELKNKNILLQNQVNYNTDISNEFEHLKDKHDSLNMKYSKLLSAHEGYEKIIQERVNIDSEKDEVVLTKLHNDENLRLEFMSIGQEVLNQDALEKSRHYVRHFVALGLLEVENHSMGDYYFYKLTSLGKRFYDMHIKYI